MCQGTNGRIWFASQCNSLGIFRDRTTSHAQIASIGSALENGAYASVTTGAQRKRLSFGFKSIFGQLL